MAQVDHTVGVCLYKLDAREEAVLKRVVTFSGAQGRNYVLTDLSTAQLVVVSNETPLDLAALDPAGAMLIRITDQDSEQPYDVLMQRPLLVTRVMRTLDEARKLWLDNLAEPVSKVTPEPPSLSVVAAAPVLPVEQKTEHEPAPLALSVAVSESEQLPEAEPALTVDKLPETEPLAAAKQLPAAEQELTTAKQLPTAEAPTTPVSVPAPIPAELMPTELAEQATQLIQAATPSAEPAVDSVIEPSGEYHHRALVVDDSAAIRKQLELELRQAGIASDFAETGEEALQKVASRSYDLIFLDIIMPGIDGYETCRQMRTRREMKKTPIIMLSAKTSPLDEVQGVIAGASTYLTKPVKSEQLQKTLKRVSMWLDNFQQASS